MDDADFLLESSAVLGNHLNHLNEVWVGLPRVPRYFGGRARGRETRVAMWGSRVAHRAGGSQPATGSNPKHAGQIGETAT